MRWRRSLVLLLSAIGMASLAGSGSAEAQERPRVREAGLRIGTLEPGPRNAITDVADVRVGHATVIEGDSIRTGVTAVLPHGDDLFRYKVPGAIAVGNGFGKLVGLSQVNELGEIETPVLLTGTLSVFRAADALVDTLLRMPGHGDVRSINPVVGETNDGHLSDIRERPIRPEHVRTALRSATGGPVAEGSVGAGTGTRALGWKGGIGTASRRVPAEREHGEAEGAGERDREAGAEGSPERHYTVGVLVQTNYGGRLRVGGSPVWRELARDETVRGGSVMIVIATDAPLDHRGLQRLATRAFLGIGRTGSWMSHGSGDYAIAFSTCVPALRGAGREERRGARAPCGPDTARSATARRPEGGVLSTLFQATVEATEEAALNSLFRATTVTGYRGRRTEALPVDRVLRILDRRGLLRGADRDGDDAPGGGAGAGGRGRE